MRQGSAYSTNGNQRDVVGKLPKEGSKLREVYDLFMTNKGKSIEYRCSKMRGSNQLTSLENFYGLDIKRTGEHQRMLVGQYMNNGEYISYV